MIPAGVQEFHSRGFVAQVTLGLCAFRFPLRENEKRSQFLVNQERVCLRVARTTKSPLSLNIARWTLHTSTVSLTHRHTHTHSQTQHAQPSFHTHSHTHMLSDTHIHTHCLIHTCSLTNPHTSSHNTQHVHMHTYILTYTHISTHTHVSALFIVSLSLSHLHNILLAKLLQLY